MVVRINCFNEGKLTPLKSESVECSRTGSWLIDSKFKYTSEDNDMTTSKWDGYIKSQRERYIPIADYFVKTLSKRHPKLVIAYSRIYFRKPGSQKKYSFRLYKESDLKLKTEIIQRTRDDDYETDDEIFEAGLDRTESDLKEMLEKVFYKKMPMRLLVRNLKIKSNS